MCHITNNKRVSPFFSDWIIAIGFTHIRNEDNIKQKKDKRTIPLKKS